MKKYFAILFAAIAFTACNKMNEVNNLDNQKDQTPVTFKFSVNQADDTKAKTDWADGDVVYVFFKDIGEKFIKMSYNESTWTTIASPEPFVAGDFLPISDENKKLTAIHFPAFVGEVSVYYDDVNEEFTFLNADGKIYTYYMYASPVTYTIDGETEVHAGINMSKPANFVQFFVPIEAAELALNHGYRLVESNLQPKACESVALDGTINLDESLAAGYALKGYRTSNGTKGNGVIFSGYLGTAGTQTTYNFSLVTNQSEAKPYALGTQTLSGTRNIPGGVIFNLPNNANIWTTLAPWVDLGLASGTKWATGNLDATAGTTKIAAPEAEGQFFMWGSTVGYSYNGAEFDINFSDLSNCPFYTGVVDGKHTFNKYTIRAPYAYGGIIDNKYFLEPCDDAAYSLTGGEYTIPTLDQITEIAGNYNYSEKTHSGGIPYKFKYEAAGYAIRGDLLTGYNGISIFIPACGKANGTSKDPYGNGFYWSKRVYADSWYGMIMQTNSTYMTSGTINPRWSGYNIRPVINK